MAKLREVSMSSLRLGLGPELNQSLQSTLRVPINPPLPGYYG